MKRLFISQPMNGKTNEEIFAEREEAVKYVREEIGEDVELIDSFIKEDAPDGANSGLWFLGKSLELLATADIAYFVGGWQCARGCLIEYDCAVKYGIDIIDRPYCLKNFELKDTVAMMCSQDYEKRFKAEYNQNIIRYHKLSVMLKKWDNGELDFTPKCPRSTYNMQIKAITDYIAVLEARGVMEGILLPTDWE